MSSAEIDLLSIVRQTAEKASVKTKEKFKTRRERLVFEAQQKRILKEQFVAMGNILFKFMKHEMDIKRMEEYKALIARSSKVDPEKPGSFFAETDLLVKRTLSNCLWRVDQMKQGIDGLNAEIARAPSRVLWPSYLKMVRMLRSFAIDLKEGIDRYFAEPNVVSEKNLLGLLDVLPLLQRDLVKEATIQHGMIGARPEPPSGPPVDHKASCPAETPCSTQDG